MFLSGSGARRLYRKWAWVWHVASGRCHKFTNNWLHGFRSRLMNGLLVFGHVFFVCFPFPVTCTQQLTSWLPDTSSPTADRMASGHKFINSWLHGFRSRALNGWLAFGHVLSFLFSISGWLVLFSSDWSTRMLLPPVWFPEIYINNNKKSPLILLPVCTVHCSHR